MLTIYTLEGLKIQTDWLFSAKDEKKEIKNVKILELRNKEINEVFRIRNIYKLLIKKFEFYDYDYFQSELRANFNMRLYVFLI